MGGKYRTFKRTIGAHTKFNQAMFEKYDIPARKVVLENLKEKVEEHPNEKKQDFILKCTSKKNKKKYKYLEVQVMSDWYGFEYPHNTLWIYERKKFYEEDTMYLTLNRNMTYGILFDRASFNDVKPRRKQKYAREYVIDIPWSKTLKCRVDELYDLIEEY